MYNFTARTRTYVRRYNSYHTFTAQVSLSNRFNPYKNSNSYVSAVSNISPDWSSITTHFISQPFYPIQRCKDGNLRVNKASRQDKDLNPKPSVCLNNHKRWVSIVMHDDTLSKTKPPHLEVNKGPQRCLSPVRLTASRRPLGRSGETPGRRWWTWRRTCWLDCTECWRDRCWCTP